MLISGLRRWLRVWGWLWLCVLLPHAWGQGTTITDSGLLAAIRAALNQPTGPVTQQDLLSLTSLNATNRNVYSTEGLEAASNLRSLYLGYNPISQFAATDGLSNLGLLDLRYCQITNCTIPPSAVQLTNLNLDDNALASFSLPATLTNLQWLNLGDNVLDDYSFVARLTNLVHLDLHNNRLTNLPPLDGLTNLTYLDLSGDSVTDLGFLAGTSSLRTLYLRANHLHDPGFPAGLVGLTSLYLNGNLISRLVLAPGMSNLVFIEVGNNPLISLSLPQASGGLSNLLVNLTNAGVTVYSYPELPVLSQGYRAGDGRFQFTVDGAPGVYEVLRSTNLTNWSVAGGLTNQFGRASFNDLSSTNGVQGFYRAASY
ncbi:MAG: leucine-rich repeat domain-containing protein [Limisphaerales bacterium]